MSTSPLFYHRSVRCELDISEFSHAALKLSGIKYVSGSRHILRLPALVPDKFVIFLFNEEQRSSRELPLFEYSNNDSYNADNEWGNYFERIANASHPTLFVLQFPNLLTLFT